HYPGRRLPSNSLPGVKTLGSWDAVVDQPWGLPWHRNEGVEIGFLETGTLEFAVDDREYILRPDDLSVTRPWQSHRIGKPNMGPNHLHWLIIDVGVRRPNQDWKWPHWLLLRAAELAELTEKLRHNEDPVWQTSADVRHCFQSMARAIEQDRQGSHVSRMAVKINELLLLILDLLRSQHLRLDPFLAGSRRTVQLFLDDLVAHRDNLAFAWTVEMMAADCGLKSTQFVYYVRQLTNMAPMHYLNHRRLGLAAELLREAPSKSVTEVAFACGFSSSQYFATLFRRRFKASPKEFSCAKFDASGLIR
ncbi:MAG TPA: AraC family transcriptional regulator, partial [Candidatus Polarisedimenticolia bacterium]|nr:AraC family transcriptional regulator [Candidatus Polarisedimenticolia bacterium]